MPSEWARLGAGRREVGVGQRRPDDPSVVGTLEPVEDDAEQPQLGVGLGAVEAPRDVGQRRAGLDQRRRDDQRAWRRVRVRERRGVDDDAGHQGGRERAVAGVERDPEAAGQQRDHLARRGGLRVDPVGAPAASFETWWSMIDARQPREQVGVADADLADPLERAAVGDDEQVVGRRRVGIGPEALDARA